MSPYQGCQHAYRPINVTTVRIDTLNVQEGRDICYCTQNVKPILHNLKFTDLLVNIIRGSRKSESYNPTFTDHMSIPKIKLLKFMLKTSVLYLMSLC